MRQEREQSKKTGQVGELINKIIQPNKLPQTSRPQVNKSSSHFQTLQKKHYLAGLFLAQAYNNYAFQVAISIKSTRTSQNLCSLCTFLKKKCICTIVFQIFVALSNPGSQRRPKDQNLVVSMYQRLYRCCRHYISVISACQCRRCECLLRGGRRISVNFPPIPDCKVFQLLYFQFYCILVAIYCQECLAKGTM